MGQKDQHGRTVYLKNIPYDEAQKTFLSAFADKVMGEETLPVKKALGRVTAQPVFATISSPNYHSAAMDGVAVKASDTFSAKETAPLTLIASQNAHWVDTGDPMPQGTDAVIMVEDLDDLGEERLRISKSVAPWENVRIYGEDLVEKELILPTNTKIRPVDLGAILAGGVREICVRKKPIVAIIPTGSELVRDKDPSFGEIIEFNSTIFASLVKEWGGTPKLFDIVSDDLEAIKDAAKWAAQTSDIIIVGAGSSHGREDYTSKVISDLGEVFVHGIQTRPGKPVVLGRIKNLPVVGAPGYPVSACLIMDLFVKPLLLGMIGLPLIEENSVDASLAKTIVSPMGIDEFLRVQLGKVGDKLVATPLARGAALTTSLTRTDGIITVPKNSEGIMGGSTVKVSLKKPLQEILGKVIAIGSHDILLDIIGSILKETNPQMSLASANQGSLGGILAVRRGEAHIAGTHLLDPQTGRYNVFYVEKYLEDIPAMLVTLVYRMQGFMVLKGNPKGIKEVSDLLREDISFVNRQKGSGTRVLLDYVLNEKGIDPGAIKGYGREEYTHTQIAACVKGRSADVGLGVLSAARALDLDFIPWQEERYDFLIPKSYAQHPGVEAILQLIQEQKFRTGVESLGGYNLKDTGKVQWQSK